jgi:isopenicillin-N N-acyltransferase like protein
MDKKELHVLVLDGSPRQRGRQHGEELRQMIGEHLDLFRENIRQDTGLDAQVYFDRFLADTNFLPAIEKYAPDLLDEVRGIAEGSQRNFDEVFARQLSDEDPWYRQVIKYGRPLPIEHCSSLGTCEKATGPNLIAQNMDSPGYYDGFQLLLKIREQESDVESLIFTVAGKLSLAGMNDRGVGICCNSVPQLDFNLQGLPEDFIVRKVLQKENLTEVLNFMHSIPHASGQNYTLGDPADVVDLECSANNVVEFSPFPSMGRVYHTNHPTVNEDTESWDRLMERGMREDPKTVEKLMARTTTYRRLESVQKAVEKNIPLDVRRAAEILSDHTAPVCLHHQLEGSYTLGCLIMELDALHPRLTIAGGPPCSTPFQTYRFGNGFTEDTHE